MVGRHVRDLAGGFGCAHDVAVALGELGGGRAQFLEHLRLALELGGDIVDLARHVDDVGREGPRLLGDPSDERLRGIFGHAAP
jgi:hypothetical protein